jgi:phytol kinase
VNLHEWLAVAAVLAGLLLGLPLVRALVLRTGASAETARKSVHVAMGLGCVAFPWIFDRPLPVWVLTAMVTVLLGGLRLIPALRSGVGSALHGIKRLSYGEILFAPAVAAVFHGSQDRPLLHVIPIGILTISDAAGALAGTRWGKRRYGCGDGFKTVEGSVMFLATAFLCVFLPLYFSSEPATPRALWIALILATLAMMAEGTSDRGFDNLVVPVGCYFVLDRLLQCETPALIGRFVAVALLLALVLWGSRWSTLSGAALLGGALLGYVCAVVADWRFALPPVAVFICHVVTTRRHKLTHVFDHRLDAVLAHSIGCLPWVIAAGLGWIAMPAGLAGISFAMSAQLAMLDASTLSWLGHFPPKPLRSTLKGWLVAGLPGLVWFAPGFDRLVPGMVIAVLATPLLVLLLQRLRPRFHRDTTRLWLIEGCLALAASSPALLTHQTPG